MDGNNICVGDQTLLWLINSGDVDIETPWGIPLASNEVGAVGFVQIPASRAM